ncbi:helix-turn-helix domain-containing protein [Natrialbaceae archaeon A-gly3]
MRTGEYTTGHAVFACRTCDNFALGSRDFLQEQSCCTEPLREVTDADVDVTTPTIETVAQQVFGLPKNGFDICQCTAEEGATTVAAVANRLDYDRSVVTRYLNTLTETGLLQKTARIRKQGGKVNVYYPLPGDELERETILGLYLWSASAAETLRDTTQSNARVEMDSGQRTQKLATVFWE